MKSLEIFIDGASRGNPGPSAAVFVIKGGSGTTVAKRSFFLGESTNNAAEYFALVVALDEAKRLKATHVRINTDSELLVKQMHGEYRIKNGNLKLFFRKAKNLASRFESFEIMHIPRSENKEADKFANIELDDVGE